MQRSGYLGQYLGAAVLFARNFDHSGRFQQAAQLSGQDGGLGGEIFIKKLIFGVM